MESYQIHFCSKNANSTQNGNKGECSYYLPNSGISSQNHLYISVQSASIPYNFYQVNSSNNQLYYVVDEIPYIVVVPEGNYNVYNFVAALNSYMAGFNITYNGKNGKLTFTNTDNKNFIIMGGSLSPMYSLLGFSSSKYSIISTSYKAIADYPINLLSTTCVCVYVDFRTGGYNVAEPKVQQLLCSIPIDVAPFGLITYRNTTNYRCNTFTNSIDHIELRLTDQSGNVLQMNNADWSITFQVDVIDFVN